MAEGTNDANGDPESYTPKYLLGVSTDQLIVPNRVGALPNVAHTTADERHFIYWKMWVAHAFLDRPVPRVEEFHHVRGDSGITVQATISSDIDLDEVRVWATEQGDMDCGAWDEFDPYPMTLSGDTWEANISEKATAYFVEVVDADGGMVSSAPVPSNEDYPLLGG